MKILAAAVSAIVFYLIMCTVINTRSENKLNFPQNIMFSDKLSTVISAVGAIMSCTALYIQSAKTITLRLILLYILCIGLALATVSDIKTKIISNKLILVLLCVWIIFSLIYFVIDFQIGLANIIMSFTGFIFSLLVFGSGYLLMKNKLGGGDVKLTLVMGLILTGDAIFGALIYGLAASLIFAAVAMITKKMKMKDSMPFAPFLFLGTAAAIAVM